MLVNKTYFLYIYDFIYFYTALVILISSYAIELRKDNLIEFKMGRNLVLVPLLFLTFLVGFRDYDVGTDTINYYDLLWQKKPEINFNNEFLFQLIAVVIKYFQLDYTVFLTIVSILIFFFIYKALRNFTAMYQANILMVLFSFMSFFFFISMSINVIRQGISLAILLYVFSVLFKKQSIVKVFIYSLIALAFHLTSIIPIILMLLSYYLSSKNKKIIYVGIIIYFLMILLAFFNIGLLDISPYLSQLLGNDGRTTYLNGETYDYIVGFKTQFVAFNTFFLLMALYVRRNLNNNKLKANYNIVLIYYIIFSCLFFLAIYLPFSDRWGLFSWCILPFLITPLFYSPYLTVKLRYTIFLCSLGSI